MKPSLPQGTRDFGPETVRKRTHILNTIRAIFELYGYQPLETPAMEQLDTLMGKYGEEGDKLIFKILNNGLNDPKNIDKARTAFDRVLQGRNDKDLTERALRYDSTIPFARYVAMNHGQAPLPVPTLSGPTRLASRAGRRRSLPRILPMRRRRRRQLLPDQRSGGWRPSTTRPSGTWASPSK